MKNIVFIFFAFFGLVSCQSTHLYKASHQRFSVKASKKNIVVPAVAKQNCILKCEHIYKSCLSQCHDSCLQCQREADKQAWERYCVYYKRMKIQGTYRPRDWLSFRDPLQCRKVSCSCPADLNVCIQQCGGMINKKLRATPYCE